MPVMMHGVVVVVVVVVAVVVVVVVIERVVVVVVVVVASGWQRVEAPLPDCSHNDSNLFGRVSVPRALGGMEMECPV